MPPYKLPCLNDVREASLLISRMVKKTPVKTSERLTTLVNENLNYSRSGISNGGVELFFKCENLQCTGSFKFRGACHFLAKLDDPAVENGVVAYSTGNHALAVAHAAQLSSRQRGLSIPSYVVVPSNCPRKKISSATAHEAKVILSGTDPIDRVILAQNIQNTTGAVLIPPADHRNIVLGQATAVQEFLQQTDHMGKSLDAIIVPSGGGGLLCGAIAVCKPRGIAVFGAEPECGGPGLASALRHGRRKRDFQGPGSVADGLRSLTGEENWKHIRAPGHVRDIFTVSEVQIHDALKIGVREVGTIIEPSAAVPLAAALFSKSFQKWVASINRPMKVGIILTGGNVSLEDLAAIIPDLEETLVNNC